MWLKEEARINKLNGTDGFTSPSKGGSNEHLIFEGRARRRKKKACI